MEYKYFVITEVGEDHEIFAGDSKTLVYKVENIGRYMVRDIQIVPQVVNSDTQKAARKSYVKETSKVPDFLLPESSFEFKVKIDIPEDYDEMSTINKQEDMAPLELHLQTKFKVYVKRNSKE